MFVVALPHCILQEGILDFSLLLTCSNHFAVYIELDVFDIIRIWIIF